MNTERIEMRSNQFQNIITFFLNFFKWQSFQLDLQRSINKDWCMIMNINFKYAIIRLNLLPKNQRINDLVRRKNDAIDNYIGILASTNKIKFQSKAQQVQKRVLWVSYLAPHIIHLNLLNPRRILLYNLCFKYCRIYILPHSQPNQASNLLGRRCILLT